MRVSEPTGWRARIPAISAGVLTANALLCAVAAISEAFEFRSQPIRHIIDVLLLPASANLGYAALIGVLAASLKRRKRVAYWFLVIFFGLQLCYDALFLPLLLVVHQSMWINRVSRVPHPLVSWLTGANLLITVGVLIVLYQSRRAFYARVQHGSLPKALGVLVGLLVVFAALGWALVGSFPGSLHAGTDQLTYSVERILGGAFTFDITRHGHAPGWVNLLLGLFGGIALFAALGVLFRSQQLSARLGPGEEERVRALLKQHGERDSLGYFATRRDKAVIFAPSGKSAVTYRVVAGVCLASGDPLGDPPAWGPAIAAWLNHAREYAWTPAVMGASEQGATAFTRAGLHAIELGDEAIVHVQQFTLDGREMRPVRQAVRRVERAGYTVRIRRHAEISPAEMSHIAELADQWRDTETERGFSMALGRLGDPADDQCILVEAHDAQGHPSGLLSFAPWGTGGLSLDLMRRDRASDNGLIEFMVTALIQDASRLGVRRISLNFAVFRSVFEQGARIGAGPILRAWRGLLLFLNRWFQMESLYRSNVKFRPEWVPRFVCFDDVRDLAKVAVASGIAEGFLVVPRLPTLLRRGVTAPTIEVPEPAPAIAPAPAAGAPSPEPVATVPAVTVPAVKVPAVKVPVAAEPAGPQAPPATEELVGAERAPAAPARTCAEVLAAHPGLAPDTQTGDLVSVCGRVVLMRDHGSLCFAVLRDATGDLQVMVSRNVVGAESLAAWKASVELGAYVSVSGEVITSRRGELSVRADHWELTGEDSCSAATQADGARPLTTLDAPARQALRARGALLQALRAKLAGEGFLEVQTPAQRPAANEPYLRWLVAGGMARVYELAPVSGDEEIDAIADRGSTVLTVYRSSADHAAVRDLARSLVCAATDAVRAELPTSPAAEAPEPAWLQQAEATEPAQAADEQPAQRWELVVRGVRLGAVATEAIAAPGPDDRPGPSHVTVLRLGVDRLLDVLTSGCEGSTGPAPAVRPGSPASGTRASRQRPARSACT